MENQAPMRNPQLEILQNESDPRPEVNPLHARSPLRWKDKTIRPPCLEDADGQGCVIAWHELDGVQITGWRYVMQNPHITHWFPTPLPPRRTSPAL